jgi:ribosomal-protein-alanine N-acetyltransferase
MSLSEMRVNTRTFGFSLFESHCFRILSKCAKIKDNRMFAHLSVRRAELSDFPAILAIEAASFGSGAYDRKLFAELHRKCGGLFLVAMRGTSVVGYAITCINPKGAELVSIAVAPRYRTRGAAAALMESVLRRLRRRKVRKFTLMVKVSNAPAIAFYEKFAFCKFRRVARYYEDGSDGFLFVRFL